MSGHERERLSAYLDGELPPGERDAVLAHLAACPECAAFLADLAAADEAAAALPVEAPEGYFETFPARVRARLRPRKAAFPARRVPAWTWAAAAALLLAVITPLTLRQVRPTEEMRSSVPVTPPPVAMKADPDVAAGSHAFELGPRASPAAPRARPTPRVALPPAAPAPAVVPPVTDAAPPESKDEGAEGVFARAPAAPPPPDEALAKQDAPAGAESENLLGSAPREEAARREKGAREAPRPAVAAEAASPTLSAASAGRAATPAGLAEHEDAFRRLEAVRPRSAAGWRRLREQWSALAAAEADPVRADEARVRAIVAAREAWRAGGDEGDEAVFRGEAESYLRREDARQKPRVLGLLAER